MNERDALLVWAALTYGQDIAQRLKAAGQGGHMEGAEALEMLAPVVETLERLDVAYLRQWAAALSVSGLLERALLEAGLIHP